MNVALSPPAHRLESSLISYSSAPSSPPYARSPAQPPITEAFTSLPPSQNPDGNINTAVISTSINREDYERMDHQPPSTSTSTRAQESNTGYLSNRDSLQEDGGQNHDRIDMDVEDTAMAGEEPPQDLTSAGTSTVPAEEEEGEGMDITPDNASSIHPQSTPTDADLQRSTTTAQGNVEVIGPAAVLEPGVEGVAEHRSDRLSPTAISEPPAGPNEILNASLVTTVGMETLVDGNAPVEDTTLSSAENVEPAAADTSGPTLTSETPVEEDDDDSEDSSSEQEHPYWASFQEDTSVPSEEELLEIERQQTEFSALDHDLWEKVVFEELDDPEYVSGTTGRITWTLQGVNGTPDNPNKEKIMRSPSVLIDGFYWSIKFFPRGNEGTDHLSVYIECSRDLPEKQQEQGCQPGSSESTTTDNRALPDQQLINAGTSDVQTADLTDVTDNHTIGQSSTVAEGEIQSHQVSVPDNEQNIGPSWEVAAQIGCVIYNPSEPRVLFSQKTAHRFCRENSDWGWTRFHGPWDTIHKRQHLRRQALLRNDTLAFTAYIRTVKDDTGALWWHPPVGFPEWESLAKTGLRGLTAPISGGNALIAALSTWLHLAPFRELISQAYVPDPLTELTSRSRPLFEQLQKTLYFKQSTESSNPISLSPIMRATKWYGLDLNSSIDVMAVWEIFRQLLNEENSNTRDTVHTDDLFRNIFTLRQNLQPDPLNEDTKMDRPEPHSIQELVTSAVSGESSAFRDWEGFYGTSQSLSDAPPILQIEIHRQNYSAKERKWSKLTHFVEINETISLVASTSITASASEYTLFGLVAHSGGLESDDFYSVLRPGGPGSKWIQYGDEKQGNVTYLTRKQAIEAHQGTGDAAEGTDAVAYIVVYVRTDCLPNILPRSPKPWVPSEEVKNRLTAVPKPLDVSETAQNTDLIPVQVYDSSVFNNFTDRGIFDPWAPEILKSNTQRTFYLELSPLSTLRDVQTYLVTKLNLAALPEQCRLWPLDTGLSSVRWSPCFESFGPGARLGSIATRCSGCRLWLHVVPMESIVPVHPPMNHATEPSETTLQEDQSTLSERPPIGDAVETPPVNESDATIVPATEPVQVTTINEDVEMGGTQEQSTAETSNPPDTIEPTVSWSTPEDVMFFVKVFDSKAQTLTGKGCHFVSKQEQIGEMLRSNGYMDSEKKYELFQEIPDGLGYCLFNADRTFDAEGIQSGVIIVVQEKLSPAETKVIADRGECSDVRHYYHYLSIRLDPVYRRPRYVYSYFGNFYFDMSIKYGRAHGHCTRIDMSGDAYVGNYTSNVRSGHGTMAYANGDTYTGNWEDDLPNGQGMMVYAKTSNTYVGGWKDGRRHGKGTMQFEVADEELQLCKICFEAEMDALLYNCGHVVACEECARQVSICPVCRRNVLAVVKIFRT